MDSKRHRYHLEIQVISNCTGTTWHKTFIFEKLMKLATKSLLVGPQSISTKIKQRRSLRPLYSNSGVYNVKRVIFRSSNRTTKPEEDKYWKNRFWNTIVLHNEFFSFEPQDSHKNEKNDGISKISVSELRCSSSRNHHSRAANFSFKTTEGWIPKLRGHFTTVSSDCHQNHEDYWQVRTAATLPTQYPLSISQLTKRHWPLTETTIPGISMLYSTESIIFWDGKSIADKQCNTIRRPRSHTVNTNFD